MCGTSITLSTLIHDSLIDHGELSVIVKAPYSTIPFSLLPHFLNITI